MKDDPTLTRDFDIDPAFHCRPAGVPTEGDERSGHLGSRGVRRSSFILHPSSLGTSRYTFKTSAPGAASSSHAFAVIASML